jgi:uncharacterized protein YbjT (DUF2867 family)
MILVTGATGTNGRLLVERLLDRAERVRVLVRSPEKAATMFPDEVEIARGDLDDRDSLQAAMEGVEKLFLLAPVDLRQRELESNAIDAAKASGVGHIVKLSIIHASDNPRSALISAHDAAEQRIRQSGLDFTFLRPNMFMQELLRQAETIRSQNAFYFPFGDMPLSLIDARDIADVAAKVLTERGHEKQLYTLTGPAAVTGREMAEALSKATARPIQYVPVTMEQFADGARSAGLPEWMVGTIVDLYNTFPGNNAVVTDDVQRLLGRPARSFRQFAQDFAREFAIR